MDLVEQLVREHGVAVIPGTTFGVEDRCAVRVSYGALQPETAIEGIGRLVRIATEEGRKTRPDLKVGVCGEHGGDPLSVHFFDEVGLNYVSCSPFRVPVARLEAGRSVLGKRDSEER